MQNGLIKAVHQRDFQKLLTSLGVYDKVLSHKSECFFCHQIVDKDTISAVFPFRGQVCLCCSKTECYTALLVLRKDDAEHG